MFNRNNQPLTLDQIRKAAPSAFATHPTPEASDRYTFIPTSDVIEAMMREGFQPTSASQSIARDAENQLYAMHMIRFRQNFNPTKVGDNALEAVMMNSHNRKVVFRLQLGVVVFACTNGLVVSDGTVPGLNVKHIGGTGNDVVEQVYELLRDGEKVTATIQLWKQIELTKVEQENLAQVAMQLRYPDKPEMLKAFDPKILLFARRHEDQGNSLWKVFNRVQENALRGGQRGYALNRQRTVRDRAIRSREVRGIERNVELNKALWTMAENAAALKLGLDKKDPNPVS